MKLPKWPHPSGKDKIELGLERMRTLLKKLGNPEVDVPPVFHVAGTNGKGSTTAFLKYIFEANGYKVHRYTSPHLVNFNERIEVCGKPITDEYYDELAEECKYVVEKHDLDSSYFEIITAIAFMAFKKNKADATILEVGLGGRLDATNVIPNPLVSVITPISFDHTEILGNTLELIALEKIRIAKQSCPVVIARQMEEVSAVLNEAVKSLSCPVFEQDVNWKYECLDKEFCLYEGFGKSFRTPMPNLIGKHQIINAGTAISAILCQNKIKISEEAIRNGLKNAVWAGRMQRLENTILNDYLQGVSELYLDGAHNEGGAKTVAEWLIEERVNKGGHNVIIMSILERKDSLAFINNIKLGIDMAIIVDRPKEQDGSKYTSFKDKDILKKEFEDSGFANVLTANSVESALAMVGRGTNTLRRVVICGSLYFIGDILELVGE